MLTRPWLTLFSLGAIASASIGCGETRDLREWTPADHQTAPPGSGVPDDDDAEPPSAGAALFSVHCAVCHGSEGRGDGPGAPPMARVPDLTDPLLGSRRTDEDVGALIASGRGFMPGFSRSIPAEGIAALVAHVRTLTPIIVAPEEAPSEEPPADVAPADEAPVDEAPPEEAPEDTPVEVPEGGSE